MSQLTIEHGMVTWMYNNKEFVDIHLTDTYGAANKNIKAFPNYIKSVSPTDISLDIECMSTCIHRNLYEHRTSNVRRT